MSNDRRYDHTIHDTNVDIIEAQLVRIADALERLADKFAPTQAQMEDHIFQRTKAALERDADLDNALKRWAYIADRP